MDIFLIAAPHREYEVTTEFCGTYLLYDLRKFSVEKVRIFLLG